MAPPAEVAPRVAEAAMVVQAAGAVMVGDGMVAVAANMGRSAEAIVAAFILAAEGTAALGATAVVAVSAGTGTHAERRTSRSMPYVSNHKMHP